MSLKSTIAHSSAIAKASTLSLWSDITFISKSPSSYDTSTGAVTSTSNSVSLKALVEKYTESRSAATSSIVLKATLLQSELDYTPDTDDLVTYDGKTWSVSEVLQDVAEATWILYLSDP